MANPCAATHHRPCTPLGLDLDHLADQARHRLAAALDSAVARHRWHIELGFSHTAGRLECWPEWVRASMGPLMAQWGTNYDQLIDFTEHGTRFTTVKTITQETNP